MRKLEDGVMEKLVNRDWKGNVRELENTIYTFSVSSDPLILLQPVMPVLTVVSVTVDR